MSTLIIAEHDNVQLQPATLCTLGAAKQFSSPITMLIIGDQCESVVEQAATLSGVHQVFVSDHPAYAHPSAEQITQLVMEISTNYQVILAPGTTFGKNVLPRIAAKLDVAQISEVSCIIDQNTFEHPIYAGNAVACVKSLDPIKVLTIRTTAFDPVRETQTPCSIVRMDQAMEALDVTFVSQSLSQSSRPSLSSAKIIVSGGRGLQNAEKFKLVEELADVLGAAVGASRAAVDAGFVPNDYQVGQTGKVVAPELYIAVGISGAIQHLAGMKDSKVIVAINKDEDAPIFQIATYGLVGDLFEAVPALIEQIKKTRMSA